MGLVEKSCLKLRKEVDVTMSEIEIQKAFDMLGLNTQERRKEILCQGKVDHYEQDKQEKYETWISNGTKIEEIRGGYQGAELEGTA